MPDRNIFLRDPNWLPSLESLFGWHDQYDRMLRWHDRLKTDNSLDMLLTFFLNCYALRDWLNNSDAVDGNVVDAAIKNNSAMKLCRDLCNRSKHLLNMARNASVDPNFSIMREYRGEGSPNAIVVLADGTKSDLLDIADQCREFWDQFLRKTGLLSVGPKDGRAGLRPRQ